MEKPFRDINSVLEQHYEDVARFVKSLPTTEPGMEYDILNCAVLYFLSDSDRIPSQQEKILAALYAKSKYISFDFGRRARRIRLWGGRTPVILEARTVETVSFPQSPENDWSFEESLRTGHPASDSSAAKAKTMQPARHSHSSPLARPTSPIHSEADCESHDRNLMAQKLRVLLKLTARILNPKERRILYTLLTVGCHQTEAELFATMKPRHRSEFLKGSGPKTHAAVVADMGKRRGSMQAKMRKHFGTWVNLIESPDSY